MNAESQPQHEAQALELTEHELELVAIALLTLTRKSPRELVAAELAAAGRLLNRVAGELMRRRDPDAPNGEPV